MPIGKQMSLALQRAAARKNMRLLFRLYLLPSTALLARVEVAGVVNATRDARQPVHNVARMQNRVNGSCGGASMPSSPFHVECREVSSGRQNCSVTLLQVDRL